MSGKHAIIGFQDGLLYLEGVQQLRGYLHTWTWWFTAVHRGFKTENCARSEARFSISLRVLKSSSGGFIVKREGDTGTKILSVLSFSSSQKPHLSYRDM